MNNNTLLENIQQKIDIDKQSFVNEQMLSYVIEKSKTEKEPILLVAIENGNIYVTKYIMNIMLQLGESLLVLDKNKLNAVNKGVLFGRFYSVKVFVQTLIEEEDFSFYSLDECEKIIFFVDDLLEQVKSLKIGSTLFVDTLKKTINNGYFDFIIDYFNLLKYLNLTHYIKETIYNLSVNGVDLFQEALNQNIETYLALVECTHLSLDTTDLQNPFIDASKDKKSYHFLLKKGLMQLAKKKQWFWLYMLAKENYHIDAMREAQDEGGNFLIHYAIAQDNYEATEFLKEKVGSSVVLRNKFNQSPVEFATGYKKRLAKEKIKVEKKEQERIKRESSLIFKIKKFFS
jgi:hypothetical protein